MKKKFLFTVILFIVLMIVFGYINFFEKKKIMEEDAQKIVFEVENMGAVKSITITPRDQISYTVSKLNEEKYILTSPFKYPVEMMEVYEMFNNLDKARSDDLVEEHSLDLSKYGLGNPVLRLDLEYENGNQTINIGDENFDNTKRYVEKDLSKNVLLIEKASVDLFMKSINDLADRHMLQLNANNIVAFNYIIDGEEMSFKLEDDKWSLIGSDIETDHDKIQSFRNRIVNISAESFYEAEGITAESFEDPIYMANVTTTENLHTIKAIQDMENEDTLILKIFKYDVDGNEVSVETEKDSDFAKPEDFFFTIKKHVFRGYFPSLEQVVVDEEITIEN